MDRLKEECGVFGIFNNKDAATLTALGLHALQHRGQEACGIVTFDEKKFQIPVINNILFSKYFWKEKTR